MATGPAPLVGVILAGGSSTRMGRDKLLLPIGGRTMLAHAIERLTPQVDRVVLSANGDPARLSSFGFPIIADAIPGGRGPLAGIHAAMLWSKASLPRAKLLVSVPTDAPFFPNLVARLLEGQGGTEPSIVVASSSSGTHPVFGLWPIALVDDLEAFLTSGASPKMLAFVDRHSHRTVTFRSISGCPAEVPSIHSST